MPELKEVFNGVLVKALGFTEQEVSSLFSEDGVPKDDAEATILERQTKAVQAARDKAKSDRDEQYNRGLREKGQQFERWMKDAGVEIGDAKGEEAVQRLKDAIEAAKKPSDLDDDKVKNSALFRKREKELMDAIAAKEAEHKQAWADRDAKDQRERTLSDAKGRAKIILDELKPVLPEDPKKAANQLGFLMQMIETFDYEIDGDDILIKDKEGKRLETSVGHPVKFTDFVKEKAEGFFDFQVSEKKGSAGDVSKGTAKGGLKLEKPANRDQYSSKLNDILNDQTLPHDEKMKMAAELKELAKDIA